MTNEEFASQAPTIIAEMEKQQAIFHAGFTTGQGPTTEERDAASEKWDELLEQLMNLCAQLFRDVGGLSAFGIFRDVLLTAGQKHGDIHRHPLLQEPKFLWSILIRATAKEPPPAVREIATQERIDPVEPKPPAPNAMEDDGPKYWRRIGTHFDGT